tara:strand:+ start:3662 stop:4234 length:573 start_codon:yes stop_codon:yes gene_type:complete
MLPSYTRSVAVIATIGLCLGFVLSNARLDTYSALLPLFEWMETTSFGVIGKTWGAVFATVEAVHLLAMAVLGGSVLVSDGRLLCLIFTDVPQRQVQDACHRLFVWSLLLSIITGVFMACGVAIKVYYLNVFWYKMLALTVGVVFVFFVRRPLLRHDIENLNPWVLRMVAVASLMIWFSVAATGRWIGFSG